uniref:Metalloproteinase inhibitor 4 n=1 Tax=Paramormyrops kingsleyae TaxID=1676925 RepID=A0A3B3TCI6_9TELE|nr:metalloproteinase inhibitor 4-like [Paramormyrops kingsleyae]
MTADNMAAHAHGCTVLLFLLLALVRVAPVRGCTCNPTHPQQQFCDAELVIRAKITREKVISPSNSSSSHLKMIQYEIKLMKVFKGFKKVQDIRYLYTPFFSSLCGIKLDSSSKVQYLIFANIMSDGKVVVELCDFVEPWKQLTMTQKKNLNYRYHMGCTCKISTCHTLPCTANVEKECLWTDWLLEDKLAGEQVRNSACIRRSDGSCSWYRGAPALEKNFLDMNDP